MRGAVPPRASRLRRLSRRRRDLPRGKSTLENAARNILTTLGTGVISRLKVRKIFVLYRRVNARLTAQCSRAKAVAEKSYSVKIIELPGNIAEADPALAVAFRLG